MSAMTFLDDDDGYLTWKAAHGSGLILNCDRVPRARYLKLHDASCSTLKKLQPRYSAWTHHYMKVCANSRIEIDDWIADNLPEGGIATLCQLCLDG